MDSDFVREFLRDQDASTTVGKQIDFLLEYGIPVQSQAHFHYGVANGSIIYPTSANLSSPFSQNFSDNIAFLKKQGVLSDVTYADYVIRFGGDIPIAESLLEDDHSEYLAEFYRNMSVSFPHRVFSDGDITMQKILLDAMMSQTYIAVPKLLSVSVIPTFDSEVYGRIKSDIMGCLDFNLANDCNISPAHVVLQQKDDSTLGGIFAQYVNLDTQSKEYRILDCSYDVALGKFRIGDD